MLESFRQKICGFGIDLSDLSIKIAHLKKEGANFHLASFGRQEIPTGFIDNGDIKQEDKLIEVIKKAVQETKGEALETKYCIVSLPETESFVRVVKLPLMQGVEAAEAIKWEIEANIPLSLEEIYYDWQIIPSAAGQTKNDHLDVLIGVLPKKTVDPYLSVLKKSGLKPLAFEIESVAIARALIKGGKSLQPTMVIDLGARRTNLLIFADQTIYFTTSLPISNSSLEEILSSQLGVSPEKAREIKFKTGLDLDHPQGQVYEALKTPLLGLCEKIKSYLDFFHEHIMPSHGLSEKTGEILLCGGGANLIDLPRFLNSQLNLPVKTGNPWVNIFDNEEQASNAGLPPDELLSFTTALGLALRNYVQH